MQNNTLEDLYKKAVKEKYEVEKNGDDFFFLNAPTRGKLNKLCWEKFTNNEVNPNDLNVFNSLLGLSFDINAKNKFKQQTNSFRPIENFFKGDSDPDKIDVVDMAAILVDFQPRPFNKFRKEIDPENWKLIEELRDTDHHKDEIFSNTVIEEVDNENFPDLKNEESEKDKNEEVEENQGWEAIPKDITDVSPPVKRGGDVWGKSGFKRYLIIATVLAGLAIIMYLSLSRKDCMQWTEDHYEKIERSGEGFCDTHYDPRYFNLKKITVCDTTDFFDDKGVAKVFYIRVGDSIECYNQFAPYPENTQRFLKPITQYMIDKHLANRPKSK